MENVFSCRNNCKDIQLGKWSGVEPTVFEYKKDIVSDDCSDIPDDVKMICDDAAWDILFI